MILPHTLSTFERSCSKTGYEIARRIRVNGRNQRRDPVLDALRECWTHSGECETHFTARRDFSEVDTHTHCQHLSDPAARQTARSPDGPVSMDASSDVTASSTHCARVGHM